MVKFIKELKGDRFMNTFGFLGLVFGLIGFILGSRAHKQMLVCKARIEKLQSEVLK